MAVLGGGGGGDLLQMMPAIEMIEQKLLDRCDDPC